MGRKEKRKEKKTYNIACVLMNVVPFLLIKRLLTKMYRLFRRMDNRLNPTLSITFSLVPYTFTRGHI